MKYKTFATIQFLQDFHEGQSSRFYRLQCYLLVRLHRQFPRSYRLFIGRDSVSTENLRASRFYQDLLKKHFGAWYVVEFVGRLAGAQGLHYPIHAEILAKNESELKAKIYDRYEIYHNLTINGDRRWFDE